MTAPADLNPRIAALAAAHFESLTQSCTALWQVAVAIVEATTRVTVEHEAAAAALDFTIKPSFAESLRELDRVTTPETLPIVAAVLGDAWAQYAGDLRKIELALATIATTVRLAINDAERLRDGKLLEGVA